LADPFAELGSRDEGAFLMVVHERVETPDR
jgi:hypothetical protein